MSATSEQAVTYVPADAGELLWVLGAFVTFKTKGESDKLSFFEVTCPPGAGPPPNIHYQQEEAFYVLEGTFSLRIGDKTVMGSPGSFLLVPRGTVHTFQNTGAETGKLIITNNLPGAHERFFREVGVPVTDIASFTPPAGPPDMEKVLSSAERNDIHFALPEAARH
jgi:mannose-6-phosphate isomerase-like protein (cupin superfamily)